MKLPLNKFVVVQFVSVFFLGACAAYEVRENEISKAVEDELSATPIYAVTKRATELLKPCGANKACLKDAVKEGIAIISLRYDGFNEPRVRNQYLAWHQKNLIATYQVYQEMKNHVSVSEEEALKFLKDETPEALLTQSRMELLCFELLSRDSWASTQKARRIADRTQLVNARRQEIMNSYLMMNH